MIRLRHMLGHAKEAVDLITGKEKAELQHNRVLELALTRLVEIVGEAYMKVSSRDPSKVSFDTLAPGEWHAQPVNSWL
jgi:uncharacterized protein with HEPN domain